MVFRSKKPYSNKTTRKRKPKSKSTKQQQQLQDQLQEIKHGKKRIVNLLNQENTDFIQKRINYKKVEKVELNI